MHLDSPTEELLRKQLHPVRGGRASVDATGGRDAGSKR